MEGRGRDECYEMKQREDENNKRKGRKEKRKTDIEEK